MIDKKLIEMAREKATTEIKKIDNTIQEESIRDTNIT